jgi:hypothetical protein
MTNIPRWRRRYFWEIVAGLSSGFLGFVLYNWFSENLKAVGHLLELMGLILIVAGVADKNYLAKQSEIKRENDRN